VRTDRRPGTERDKAGHVSGLWQSIAVSTAHTGEHLVRHVTCLIEQVEDDVVVKVQALRQGYEQENPGSGDRADLVTRLDLVAESAEELSIPVDDENSGSGGRLATGRG